MHWRFRELGWRLVPGSFMALVFAALLKVGVFNPFEQGAYTALAKVRGERPWDDRLVLVNIDDASIRKLGRFPWSRQQYIRLLQVLASSNASIVGIDLIFSEPSPDDPRLAQAMTSYGRVVLANAYDVNGFPLTTVATLQNAAIATGHMQRDADPDGVIRSVPLYVNQDPVFGLAVVQAYSLVHEEVVLPKSTDLFWINWVGRAEGIQHYSFADVVEHKIPPQVFQNKIVLVGSTASGIDSIGTPFNRSSSASGIHLHAALVNNLLNQNGLQPLFSPSFPVILILAGPGLCLLLSRRSEKQRFLIWLVAGIGWSGTGVWLFSVGYWVPIVLPLSLLTLTTIATSLTERLRMDGLLRDQVQQLWQAYQKDLVVRKSSLSADVVDPLPTDLSSPSIQQLAALAGRLGRSQSAQAAIAQSLPIGLLAADLSGVVWFCNAVATDWLHIRTGDELKHYLVPDWLDETQWEANVACLTQHRSVPPEELQRGDRWYALKLEPLMYRPGSMSEPPSPAFREALDGLLVVLEDITTKKQAEATLEYQVQELQRLSHLKDDFLSTVSHELRSPMTNIQMAIELLKISKSADSSAHYLKILQSECAREIELINDLLDLQRLEAGAQNFLNEEIHLQTWLPPIIQPFYERAATQQQTLEVELAPQLPNIRSDVSSLERVLAELVNNACKYTPSGETIRVIAQVSDRPNQSGDLELIVSNSGTEIPQAELSRIFEKFYRVPQADPWKRGGTGLGLALVKKLVECMGGTIRVESDAGHTQFHVQLPLQPPIEK